MNEDVKYLAASDGTGPAVLAHISGPRVAGSTVIPLDNTDNWSPFFIITTGSLAPSGFIDPNTVTEAFCHLDTSGNAVIDKFAPGYGDNGNTQGQVAVIKQTISFADIVAATLAELQTKQSIPVGARQEYYGTKATFDTSEFREGWLFPEKGENYLKEDYPSLYDHLNLVDSDFIVDADSFTFPDKWFGTVPVSVDPDDSDFNTLGKSGGDKRLQKHAHTVRSRQGAGNWGGTLSQANGAATDETVTSEAGEGMSGNLQPYISVNYLIKI